MISRLFAAGSAVAIAFAGPASAAIDIFNVSGAVQPPENVLVVGGDTGETVFGYTNNTNTSVSFRSPASGISLAGFADGQSRVEAVGGPLDVLRFFRTDGGGFDEVEFDLHKANGGTANVTVT